MVGMLLKALYTVLAHKSTLKMFEVARKKELIIILRVALYEMLSITFRS